MKPKKITAEEFEAKFDAGEDISEYVDWSKATHPMRELHRVNVDFPKWVVFAMDRESARMGITRQSLIKLWIAERVDQLPNIRALNQSAIEPPEAVSGSKPQQPRRRKSAAPQEPAQP